MNAGLSGDARRGDLAFLYVGRPVSGIIAVLSVDTDPSTPVPSDATQPWSASVGQQTILTVLPDPLPYSRLVQDSILADSAPVRRNFQLTSAALTGEQTRRLVELSEQHDRDLQGAIAQLPDPDPGPTFDRERDLEAFLVDHLDRVAAALGMESPLRLADADVDGIAGRQPALPHIDNRPDLVVVSNSGQLGVLEVKNVPARPQHVGQLAHYVAWIRHHVSGGADAWGALVTTRHTLAARTALTMVPGLRHVSVGEVTGHHRSGQPHETGPKVARFAADALIQYDTLRQGGLSENDRPDAYRVAQRYGVAVALLADELGFEEDD